MEICYSSGNDCIYAWDIRTSTLLGTFKSNHSSPQTNFTITNSHILSPQQSALMNVYSISNSTLSKHVMPETITSICVSNSGTYLVCGGKSGRLHIWNLTSGEMIKSVDCHFKSISKCCFTTDDEFIITAGHDSLIHVYALASLVDAKASDKPMHSLAGHTLSITDIKVSMLLSKHSRIYSVSMDKTCKVWELSTGKCLQTIVFPKALTSLAIDATEVKIYVGTNQEEIYGHLISKGEYSGEMNKFKGHEGSINGMDISMDGGLLVSGGSEGRVIVWDTNSGQSLRTFSHHVGQVSHISVKLFNGQLGNVQLEGFPQLKRYPNAASDSNESQMQDFKEFQMENYNQKLMIEISTKVVDILSLYSFVSDPTVGGISSFVGVTRDYAKIDGKIKKVLKLEYEAYIPMAIKVIEEIAKQLMIKYEIEKIAIVHRIGKVEIGEASLAVVISGNHRKDPMDAVIEAVNQVKKLVPIWKKEIYEDGKMWKGNVEFLEEFCKGNNSIKVVGNVL